MKTEQDLGEVHTEQREITREYFETLAVKREHLFEKAQTAESRDEFIDAFDHIIRINRIQMGLLNEMYIDRHNEANKMN